MHLDGFDFRAAPLLERKRVLAGLLEAVQIVYSEHVELDGAVIFEHTCKLQLEAS